MTLQNCMWLSQQIALINSALAVMRQERLRPYCSPPTLGQSNLHRGLLSFQTHLLVLWEFFLIHTVVRGWTCLAAIKEFLFPTSCLVIYTLTFLYLLRKSTFTFQKSSKYNMLCFLLLSSVLKIFFDKGTGCLTEDKQNQNIWFIYKKYHIMSRNTGNFSL